MERGYPIVAKEKPWDSILKQLIRVNPASFVQWLIPGTVFVKEQPQDLESQKREVDALLEVVADEQRALLHIEFQTYRDTTMAELLLLYNVLARSVYNLPVLSCVIYLLKDGTIPQSPLLVTFPGGKKVHEFHFESIEIGKLSADDILDLNIIALIPLIPLTKDGTSRDTLIQMFTELKERCEASGLEAQLSDLEVVSYTLASLVLQRKNVLDLEWLIRRFREMHEIIRDTPIYQEILREGREEGLEQGIEQGSLNASRRILLLVIQIRFPVLASLAQELANLVKDENILDDIIGKISAAQSEDEAFSALREQYHKFRN